MTPRVINLRALQVGEIIQQGDLYLDEDGKYHPSELINEEVKEWHNPPSWWRPEF